MGTTLSSSSHFVAFELLQLRRQVTVMMVGCISIFFDAYALLEDLLFGPSLLDIAFYSITFRLSFRLFLADLPSGTECLAEYRLGTSLSIRTSHCTGTLPALQLLCFPGIDVKTCAFSCFSWS